MSKRYRVLTQLMMAVGLCLSPYQSLAADKFDVMAIANDLDHPWSLQELPNHPLNFLVTERSGGFKLISELGFVDEIPLPLPDLFVSGQGGLFEVSLAPDFNETREAFFSYACGNIEANSTCVARAELTPTRPMKVTELRKIFVAQPLRKGAAHYGGRLAWLPDQTLLLTLGDGFDYREEAQNLSNHLGKVVRMTRTGEAAPGNPFPHQAGGYIYSYGHRNSQGIVYDSTTESVWQHEHGPRGGDELNQLHAGKNYGWPMTSYGIDYTGAMVTPYQELPGVVAPIYQWTPSLAPSDMALYNAEMFSEWRGALLITQLAGKRLQVLQQRQQAWQVVHQLTLADEQRLRAVTVASDGAIYLLTDSAAGQLLRLSR
ncbi:Aldose sugar dehydrogenase YliI [Pseudidiomarina piscicola]|uniref:Aldose sugar dehydrogenase YliI n=1 Tax=Pseudidiomarina piscicola TaxID=2614830 RepID=A0A6S6WUL1_9GAMM|nr:PQQ-dependent sugar dehydrogenase [Pseudidiomarina piscicola]CAB0150867.1 Aldose sugar dehydrogenase YliI [Pseudidiomarina piscicola]VZT40372.1 Aldose sugar dehydrogenase YliI [Pseudomonas aeruginosa]